MYASFVEFSGSEVRRTQVPRASHNRPRGRMRPSPSSFLRSFVWLSFSLCILASTACAQQVAAQQAARAAAHHARRSTMRNSRTLRGNTHPLAVARFDRGAALADPAARQDAAGSQTQPEQDAALMRLLDEQQDKSSPQLPQVARSRGVRQALRPRRRRHSGRHRLAPDARLPDRSRQQGALCDEILRHRRDGAGRLPHARSISYAGCKRRSTLGQCQRPPDSDALTPVVTGVWTMHDFRKKPQLRMSSEHFPLVR